jgi:hypothetical protein
MFTNQKRKANSQTQRINFLGREMNVRGMEKWKIPFVIRHSSFEFLFPAVHSLALLNFPCVQKKAGHEAGLQHCMALTN